MVRPVPVLTRAVVQWAWCYGPSSTPALPHCYFFISLVLAQDTVLLSRPTAWTHSCCRALEAFPLRLSPPLGLCLWSFTVTAVLTWTKGSGYVQTHLLTKLCKPSLLWCGVITLGLLKGQMSSDHSEALLPHVSVTVNERWTKWTGGGQKRRSTYDVEGLKDRDRHGRYQSGWKHFTSLQMWAWHLGWEDLKRLVMDETVPNSKFT